MARNILITGSTSGIGYFAALKLIKNGHNLIITSRNQSRICDLKKLFFRDNITKDQLYKQVDFNITDLSDLKSVESFVDKLLLKDITIDTLVLNAGLQYTGSKEIRRSAQNIELTFAVNHLSHHYLAQMVIPLLSKSKKPRIIITSSDVHNPETSGGKIGKLADLGNLEGLANNTFFSMIDGSSDFNADKAYKDSKLCNILFAQELFKRLNTRNLNFSVVCWAPGLVIPRESTGFFRYSRKYNEIGQIIFAFLARDLLRITESPEGAGNILSELSILDKYQYKSFVYLANRNSRIGKMIFGEANVSKEAHNMYKAEKLWNLSNRLLKEFVKLN